MPAAAARERTPCLPALTCLFRGVGAVSLIRVYQQRYAKPVLCQRLIHSTKEKLSASMHTVGDDGSTISTRFRILGSLVKLS